MSLLPPRFQASKDPEVTGLAAHAERAKLVEAVLATTDQDNELFLKKLKDRLDK